MPNQCGEVSIDSNPTAGAPTWPAAENVSTVLDKPSSQGGTIMFPVTPTAGAGVQIKGPAIGEFTASNSLQPPPAAANGAGTQQLFQEVQMFIGEVARVMGIAPRAAWVQIRTLGEIMFRLN